MINFITTKFFKLSLFKNLNIQLKILVSFSLLIVITIITIGFVAILKFSKTMKETTSMYSYQIIDQVIKNVDSYVGEMKSISSIANYNDKIQKFLDFNDTKNNVARIKEEDTIVDLLDNIKSTREDINSIIVLGTQGSIISSNQSYKINSNYNFLSQPWYTDALNKNGSYVIVKPHKQNYLINSDNLVISLSKSINKFDSNEQLGVILIDINLKAIDNICKNIKPGKNGYVFIIDKEGDIIYHPDYDYMYRSMDNLYAKNIFKTDDIIIPDVLNSKEGSFVDSINSKKNLITYKKSPSTEWTIISVTPYNEMMLGITNVTNYIIFIVVLCLFGAFLVSALISSMISKPLKKLEILMKEAENGNMNVSIDINSKDEIGLLSQRFNNMIFKIKSLMDEIVHEQENKRRYEFKALQSQINPHFLYNTLDAIMWMAETKSEYVVTMIDSLSKLLRISLSKGNETIKIKSEIEHVRNYLIILSLRYINKFDYEIDIDEKLLEKDILKLILQPIVENSIYHGIKNKRRKGTLKITGRIINDTILFEIIDDGIGMEPNMCKDILKKDLSNKNRNGFNGFGVLNVNDRIKLYYGDNYGIKYSSILGESTTVQIFLPLI